MKKIRCLAIVMAALFLFTGTCFANDYHTILNTSVFWKKNSDGSISPRSGAMVAGTPFFQAYTSTGTVSERSLSNGIATNTGASGSIVLTIPDITIIGQRVIFILTAAQDVDLNPDDSDTILLLTNAAGDAVSSDATIGSFLELVAVSLTEWMPMNLAGPWTDVN